MLTPQFWIQSLWLAFSQIWANKTRSVLTALGIIVGVASVTAVIAALGGLKAKVLTEFESFGANRVFIFPNRPGDAPRNKYPWDSVRLKPSEAIELRDQATSLKALTPIVEISGAVESDTKKLDSMQIVGIWPDWHPIEGRRVIMGRAFGQVDEDNARQVCLVNDRAIEELRLPNDPTGTTLLVAGRRFLVVGVIETLQSRMFGFETQASEVFIPFSLVMKLTPDRTPFIRFSALLKDAGQADEAIAECRFLLRKVRGLRANEPDTFRVEAIDRYIEQFKTLSAGITAVAGGIVGISLLVGGIGIMNIMLVSVSERTREIGLRKAVGATGRAIMVQFLLEAVALCFSGGFVGVACGKVMAFGLARIPGAQLEQASVPFWAVLGSFLFSAFVGVLFGLFPAIKAARLDPIEALRHE